MAKLVQGILGGFSGKVGSVVGSIWKGIAVIRGYNPIVNSPNTVPQLTQQQKFSLVGTFLRPLTAFLRKSFGAQAIKMTAFNAAMKKNLAEAISGVYPNFAINYAKAVLCRGNLTGALQPLATALANTQVEFTWEDNSGQDDAQPTDKVVMIVYNPVRNQAITKIGVGRSMTQDLIQCPFLWSDDSVEAYISFCNAAESVFADSAHVKQLVVT